LCGALAHAYRNAAGLAGHNATLLTLADLAFDPILHEGDRTVQPLEPDLEDAYRQIAACDHLVLIFPLWCGDMPALMKGFFERILQPGLVAQESQYYERNHAIFKDKSARIIMTMGMPVAFYRYWYGAHALKLLRRNILAFVGIRPVRDTLFGMVASSTQESRDRWIAQVKALGQLAA
jgi:putative NADPH-quinone reductase